MNEPWNKPDPWEGHTCGECRYCGDARMMVSESENAECWIAICQVCSWAPMNDEGANVDRTYDDERACEAFEAR